MNRWELPDRVAHVLGGRWAARARAEREASIRLHRLSTELAAAGAAPELRRLAQRAAADEARHVDICVEMAAAYGRPPQHPQPAPEAAPLSAPGLAGGARLLYELVAFAAIAETVNASLLRVAHQRARVPEVHAALGALLADEVGHSRLGWAYLADEHARGRTGFIAGFVPRMLQETALQELFAGDPPATGDGDLLGDHGELREPQRLAVFTHTLRDVVFPGLAALGVSPAPARAWLRATELTALPYRLRWNLNVISPIACTPFD